ncbi:hypothetical protein T459_17820 [Capsicum annuum]|uniref:Myosin motor domain-containing protein n=1 Tax=Capsicum annuum TaxID=4072 RepID=A0A2G2ZCQ6_CAPAN|nr:hypothetical protein FXO37_03333 [Capsicum annuum]PHT79768.1 hypothetical protein T459_17820 [Capsicum annuum]
MGLGDVGNGLVHQGLDLMSNSWLENKKLVDWEHFIEKVLVRFPKLHLESLENHLANQMPSSRFEAISWGMYFLHALHMFIRNGEVKKKLALPQKFDMQSECKSKMDAHNIFDEMSTRVFIEEVEETSFAAILLCDLDDIQSTRVLDEYIHNCCHKLVAEVQPNTPIKMLDEEALCLERSKSNCSMNVPQETSALKMAIQGKESPKAICIARLQGCIRSMADLIGLELCNFSTLAELKGLVGAQVASIVVAYVVHKAILSESKSFSVLASCGKFKTMMRLKFYVAHLGGHRCVEECTVAQQVLKSNPVFKALNNVDAIQSKFSSHNGIFVEIHFAKLGKTLRGPKAFSYIKRSYCLVGITDAHDSPHIEKVMKIVGLSKAEQVTIFKILASVMMLSNIDLAKGNEIVSSILHVDNTWFYLCTTLAALYTHSSLERFNIILSVWFHSNLEGKVLIREGSIVMNWPKSVTVR